MTLADHAKFADAMKRLEELEQRVAVLEKREPEAKRAGRPTKDKEAA